MVFTLAPSNFKKVLDKENNITIELDYSDSNNKKIICSGIGLKESLVIVDNRNFSCEIYLKKDTEQKIIDSIKQALPVLGFKPDQIFFR